MTSFSTVKLLQKKKLFLLTFQIFFNSEKFLKGHKEKKIYFQFTLLLFVKHEKVSSETRNVKKANHKQEPGRFRENPPKFLQVQPET